MISLDELRNKWFLNFDSPESSFPPVKRHKGSQIKKYTDNNLVTPLIDGQSYMKEWHDSIRSMIGQKCEVYHAGWRFEGVRTLGYSQENSDALQTLVDAVRKGVNLRILLCNNQLSRGLNWDSGLWLRKNDISSSFDTRFPTFGSNHHKFTVFKTPTDAKAILGIDISKTRWDTRNHLQNDPERDPSFGKPTHDIGVLVRGPAVTDIELSFRERWNDSSRQYGLFNYRIYASLFGGARIPYETPSKIETPVSLPDGIGSHSVQVLHTYGCMSHGYSWSSEGEFTIWSSYLNAIKNAKKYIYIEDQYLLTFGYPSYSFSDEARARESDLIWQLGMAALERNVKIVVLVPNVSEDALRGNQEFQRVYGLWIMREIAGPEADIIIATLHNGSSSIYVHSKLMICDDEFVLIGSANFCQRSMTHDGELHIGVVDEKNNFARQLRIALWQEHMGLSSVELPLLEDIDSAYAFFKDFAEKGENAAVSENRLRRYEAQCKVAAPDHRAVISCIDPYAGPPRFLGAE